MSSNHRKPFRAGDLVWIHDNEGPVRERKITHVGRKHIGIVGGWHFRKDDLSCIQDAEMVLLRDPPQVAVRGLPCVDQPTDNDVHLVAYICHSTLRTYAAATGIADIPDWESLSVEEKFEAAEVAASTLEAQSPYYEFRMPLTPHLHNPRLQWELCPSVARALQQERRVPAKEE